MSNKIVFLTCMAFFCIAQGVAEIYDFNMLSSALLDTSPKLKQNEIEVMIAKENIDVANAGYYPSLRFVSNLERSRKFENMFSPTYVGDDSLTQSDGRYISASLYFTYDIYHFGATDYSLKAAEANMNVLSAAKCIKEKESLLSLLEAYSRVRSNNYQLEYYGKIQELYTELYGLTKRLHESGNLAKTSSLEYAKELADVITLIAGIKEERANYFSQIIYLSGINIDENDILQPLDESAQYYQNIAFENSATAKQMMSVISQKQAELNLEKTNYLPAISFYARYDMYGSSSDSYNEALNDLGKNGYRFGISFSLPLFDGFRSDSRISIKRLELTQSRLAYEDAKRAYEKEQFLVNSQISLAKSRLDSVSSGVQSSDELVQADTLLYNAGELDRITLLNDQINRHKINISLKEAHELLSMNIKKREIMNDKEGKCAAL
ncbi:MAG: TolC family protein [Campylobacteraceae bacterium]|nr:TolC family protein [Campylobacteraceae bacterium]